MHYICYSGCEQAQRRNGSGEDVQPAVAHAAAGGADEGVRGAAEGQAREHRQAARHRGGAGGPRQGHRHGTLHG